MAWIAPAVARDTRVCVYDRAGRGWSEPADTPQDGTQIATDLHTLLQRANVPGPYVLAGHSFGGLYVLTYAARYPDEVAGMVLVDSTEPGHRGRPGEGNGVRRQLLRRRHGPCRSTGRGGCTRGTGAPIRATAYGELPAQSRDEVRAATATADYASGWIEEFVQSNAAGAEAAMLTDFGDRPLVVLTAGAETDPTHDAAQNQLATLSTNSSHRVVEGASHAGLIVDQHYARPPRVRSSTSSPRCAAQPRCPGDPVADTQQVRSRVGRRGVVDNALV